MITDIKFIDHELLENPEIEKIVEEKLPIPDNVSWFFKTSKNNEDYKKVNMPKQLEKILFLQYNYAKKQISQDNDVFRWKKKVKEIQTILVSKNVALVKNISTKFIKAGLKSDDLVSVGFIALLNAIDKFNIKKNYRFSTYATYVVRNAFLAHLEERQNYLSKNSLDNKTFIKYIYEIKNNRNSVCCRKDGVEKELIDEMKGIIDDNTLGFDEEKMEIIRLRFVEKQPYRVIISRMEKSIYWIKNCEKMIVDRIKGHIEERFLGF